MPPKPWKTLSSREIYQNKWMSLREDVAEMPNGQTTIYGVCTFSKCVGVLPFGGKDSVILVRQYRYVQRDDFRWEMPTGGIQPDQTPQLTPQLVIDEEGGYYDGQLVAIGSYL